MIELDEKMLRAAEGANRGWLTTKNTPYCRVYVDGVRVHRPVRVHRKTGRVVVHTFGPRGRPRVDKWRKRVLEKTLKFSGQFKLYELAAMGDEE